MNALDADIAARYAARAEGGCVDAATLRGLGPDQVLVLINGKRRHTSSLVYIFGTRGRGNVGNSLPWVSRQRGGVTESPGLPAAAAMVEMADGIARSRRLGCVASGMPSAAAPVASKAPRSPRFRSTRWGRRRGACTSSSPA